MEAVVTNESVSEELTDYLDNVSESQYGNAGLLDVYYSTRRFATETVCALVAAAANMLVLVAMRRAYDIVGVGQNRTSSAYSILFVNLSIANSLSCILSWLANNSLFLFNRQLIEVLNTEPCLFFMFLWNVDVKKDFTGERVGVRRRRRRRRRRTFFTYGR